MLQSMSAPRPIGLTVVLMACAFLAPVASAAAESECPVNANQEAASGPALKPQISLEATPATEVTNFGGSRGTKQFYAIFKASRPLPKSLTPAQIEITVPRPPRRVIENVESASLAFPTFAAPRFINGRREIQLLTCISAAEAEAGSYTGLISVSGPSGLTGASVTTTFNAKDDIGFLVGLVIVLLAAAVILYFFRVREEMQDKAWWWKALAIVISVAASGIAMWGIYSKDPAWGADLVSSVLALGGTAFGAVGIGSLVSPLVKQVTP